MRAFRVRDAFVPDQGSSRDLQVEVRKVGRQLFGRRDLDRRARGG